MYDARAILIGLLIFAAIAVFPFWFSFTSGDSEPPDLPLPTKAAKCIESKEYMRAQHMDLLNQWRDAVVREGQRVYVSTSGERFQMSLTNTCLDCHTSKAEFCDQCHSYLAVAPECWNCHIDTTTPAGHREE